MGFPMGGRVAVVPEAVDTDLYDPKKVRTLEQGNLFRPRSRTSEDLCSLIKSPFPSPVIPVIPNLQGETQAQGQAQEQEQEQAQKQGQGPGEEDEEERAIATSTTSSSSSSFHIPGRVECPQIVRGGAQGRSIPQQRNVFSFLSTFKWEYRKGWDVLLDAYCKSSQVNF